MSTPEFADVVVSAYGNILCEGNFTSRSVKPMTVGKCQFLSASTSTLTTYEDATSNPIYSVYGYSIVTYASAAACDAGDADAVAAEVIYNRAACIPDKDVNGNPTGRYYQLTCDDTHLFTTSFADFSCSMQAPTPVSTALLTSSCASNLQAQACVQQVPTLQPTLIPPTPSPSPPPTVEPTWQPSPLPTPFPTLLSAGRAVFFSGTNSSAGGTYSTTITLRGLETEAAPGNSSSSSSAQGQAQTVPWFLTVDLLGTGFADPEKQRFANSRVTVSAVARAAPGKGALTVLFSDCAPSPLCDNSDATGFTTCLANADVSPLVDPQTGQLHITAFTVGPATAAVCPRGDQALLLRFTVSGTWPNPTAAPSPSSGSPPDVDDALGNSAAATPVRDVFSSFRPYMFLCFIAFALFALLLLQLLRLKGQRVAGVLAEGVGKLGGGTASVAQLPSFYALSTGAVAYHVLVFGSSLVLEALLSCFLLTVGDETHQQHLTAMGALLLASRGLLLAPNLLVAAAALGPDMLSALYAQRLDRAELARPRGRAVFAAVGLLVCFDATFVRFLPWRRTKWTDASHGYPGFLLMRFCVYSKVAQCVVAAAIEGAMLGLCRRDGVSTTTAFTAAALALTTATLLHCMSSIYFLVEEGKRHKQRDKLKKLMDDQPALQHHEVHGPDEDQNHGHEYVSGEGVGEGKKRESTGSSLFVRGEVVVSVNPLLALLPPAAAPAPAPGPGAELEMPRRLDPSTPAVEGQHDLEQTVTSPELEREPAAAGGPVAAL